MMLCVTRGEAEALRSALGVPYHTGENRECDCVPGGGPGDCLERCRASRLLSRAERGEAVSAEAVASLFDPDGRGPIWMWYCDEHCDVLTRVEHVEHHVAFADDASDMARALAAITIAACIGLESKKGA